MFPVYICTANLTLIDRYIFCYFGLPHKITIILGTILELYVISVVKKPTIFASTHFCISVYVLARYGYLMYM